jgi:hypothetical protein
LYARAEVDNIVNVKYFQPQQESNQWGAGAGAAAGGYYAGYGQGYSGYAQPQDPNMYGYGAYPGYPNYQQPAAGQQPPQQVKFLTVINLENSELTILFYSNMCVFLFSPPAWF